MTRASSSRYESMDQVRRYRHVPVCVHRCERIHRSARHLNGCDLDVIALNVATCVDQSYGPNINHDVIHPNGSLFIGRATPGCWLIRYTFDVKSSRMDSVQIKTGDNVTVDGCQQD